MKNFIKMLSIGFSVSSSGQFTGQFTRTVRQDISPRTHKLWFSFPYKLKLPFILYNLIKYIFITVLFDCEKKYFHMYFQTYTLRIIFYPQLPWYFSEVFVWLILWLLWTTLIFCWSKMTSIIHWLRSWRTLFPLSHKLWFIDNYSQSNEIIKSLYLNYIESQVEMLRTVTRKILI